MKKDLKKLGFLGVALLLGACAQTEGPPAAESSRLPEQEGQAAAETKKLQGKELAGLAAEGSLVRSTVEAEKTVVPEEKDADEEVETAAEQEAAEPVYEEPVYEDAVAYEESAEEEPVYEEPAAEPTYTYETTYEEVILPKTQKYIGNPQMDNDQFYMQQSGQDGKLVHTWLHVYEDGQWIDSHITKTSQIDPVPDIFVVGTNIVVIPESSSYEKELAKMKELFPEAFE